MEVDFVSSQQTRFEGKTKTMIAEAIHAAKKRAFEYDGKKMTYHDLSTCMKRIVDKMYRSVERAVGSGMTVRDAISFSVASVRSEFDVYSLASRQQAEDIVRQTLNGVRVERLLRAAHKRMVPRAPNTHKRVGHRHLMPVPMR